MHEEVIAQHGGRAGIRDEGLLESALTRARHVFLYEQPDRLGLPALAAAYGFGLAKNHPFVDGNKRTAFQATFTFLGINGRRLTVAEAEAVDAMLALATGRWDETRFAAWLGAHLTDW